MEEIREKLLERIRYTEKEFQPFLICFSGTPLAGKSTIAKVLQERYKMVRIENDMVRKIGDEEGIYLDAYSFLIYFLKNYSQSNGRIVLDSSIDRNYEDIFKICRDRDIPVFKIKMPVPQDFDARSLERNSQQWEEWFQEPVEKYLADHRQAVEKIDFDFVLGQDGGMKKLLEKLDNELGK